MNIIISFLFFNYLFFSVCFANFKLDFNRDMMFIQNGTYVPLFKDENLNSNIKHVDSFFLNKYHVTNFDFFIFILNNPEWDINNAKHLFIDLGYLNKWRNIDNFICFMFKPVVYISWFVAEAYCNFLKCRLPLMDEWEYVGSHIEYDNFFLNGILNWYINPQYGEMLNVHDMNVNIFGVNGMHGIVWEWVYDFNGVILINTDAEGGNLEELLYCGATAVNAIDPSDYIAFMRFAFRNTLEANYTMSKLGFRCAKYD